MAQVVNLLSEDVGCQERRQECIASCLYCIKLSLLQCLVYWYVQAFTLKPGANPTLISHNDQGLGDDAAVAHRPPRASSRAALICDLPVHEVSLFSMTTKKNVMMIGVDGGRPCHIITEVTT